MPEVAKTPPELQAEAAEILAGMQDIKTDEEWKWFYRTQFLMAHHRLHKLAHNPATATESVLAEWHGYLEELKTAPEVSKQPL